jgi:hypothetical protein
MTGQLKQTTMEYFIYFSAKTTFVGRQRLTCQRLDLNYLAELI